MTISVEVPKAAASLGEGAVITIVVSFAALSSQALNDVQDAGGLVIALVGAWPRHGSAWAGLRLGLWSWT